MTAAEITTRKIAHRHSDNLQEVFADGVSIGFVKKPAGTGQGWKAFASETYPVGHEHAGTTHVAEYYGVTFFSQRQADLCVDALTVGNKASAIALVVEHASLVIA